MDGGEGRRGKEGRKEGSLSLSLSLARWVDLPLQRFAVAFVHTKVSGISPTALSRSPLVRPLACMTMMERPNWIGLLFLDGGGGGGTSTRKSALSLALALDCLSTLLDFNFQIPL